MNIIENYPLLKLNTFGVDVKAKYFTSINTINELIEVTKTNVFKDLELLILVEEVIFFSQKILMD